MNELVYILLLMAGITIALCFVQAIAMIYEWYLRRDMDKANKSLPWYIRRLR